MLFGIIFLAFFCFLYYLFELMAVAIVILIISTILTLIYFHQNKLLYMPVIPDMPKSPRDNPYHQYRHPSSLKLITKDLELQSEDEIKIRGWHVQHQKPEQLIVYFHQNAGNIGFRIPLIKQLSKNTNSDVILVAYRGYSDSDGIPTEEGLQKDAQAVLKYVIRYAEEQENKLKIFLYGRSLGGAVSIYIGSHPFYKNKISGLILQNTFTSISDMIDAVMPIFKYVKFLQRNHWQSIQRIPQIQKPILFIRSLRDEIVPTSQMIRLIQNIDQNVHFEEYQIQNGTHNCSWEIDRDEYFGKINQFLSHPKVAGGQE